MHHLFFCFSCVLLFLRFFFSFFWTFVTFVSTNESYRPAASYQPSERSDFSFDNLSTTTENNVQSKQPQSLPPPQQPHQSQSSRNVQRSVSQPECANEKSLFKWVWMGALLSWIGLEMINWTTSVCPLRNLNATRSAYIEILIIRWPSGWQLLSDGHQYCHTGRRQHSGQKNFLTGFSTNLNEFEQICG